MDRTLETAEPVDVGLNPEALDRVDALIQEYVDAGVLAGAVTVVARHGRIAHTSVLGVDNLTTGKPLLFDTIFRIFSMTKPVTAVAMMILHERGLWKAEDPIRLHVPEFAGLRVFVGFDADGSPILADADHEPTMSELMTHTAGFSYGDNPEIGGDAFYVEAGVRAARSSTEFIDRIASVPLVYQPGTRWLYSLSVDIQGVIVERLSGLSLGEFFDQEIFAPLEMGDTAFFVPPEKSHRLAALYASDGSGNLDIVANPLLPDFTSVPPIASGGAGLMSTARDYARFAQLLLNGGEFGGHRVLTKRSVDDLMSNHVSDAIIRGGFGVGKQRIRPGVGFGYDGIVFTDPALAGIPVGRGTYHWDGAAGTWFWVDPENDLLYVGLIQLFSPNSPALQSETQTAMADAIIHRPSSQLRPGATLGA